MTIHKWHSKKTPLLRLFITGNNGVRKYYQKRNRARFSSNHLCKVLFPLPFMQENFLGHLFWQIHCIQDPCTFCKCANGIVLSQENAETFTFKISFSNWKLNEFKFVSLGPPEMVSVNCKSICSQQQICKFWNRFLLLWKNPPLHFFSPRAIIIFF